MTRVNKKTGKKEVALRILFEMFKFNIFGLSFKQEKYVVSVTY